MSIGLAWFVTAVLTYSVPSAERETGPADMAGGQGDSTDGDSTWQWWPPGKVCYYTDGTESHPSAVRSAVVVALVVVAAIAIPAVAIR